MDPLDKIDQKIDKVLDKLNEHSVVLAQHGALHEQNADFEAFKQWKASQS